jgi:aspartate kinase
MSVLVQKFGGTSVADPARILAVAAKVAEEVRAGHRVAIVTSAMAGATNQLVAWCRDIVGAPENLDGGLAEYDAVVASGEQVTAGLLALALRTLGIPAQSFTGWQAGLETNATHSKAQILKLDPVRLQALMNQGGVPVLTGFQGVTADGRVTTLGRGGSDTSAVALAAALKADRCDIYTDVDGVYTSDPRIVKSARRLPQVTFEEMLELASLGAKVLHPRSVELALRYHVPVQVLSSFDSPHGSMLQGTLITAERTQMEGSLIRGIAHSAGEAKITLVQVPDKPGIAADVFSLLADAAINVDMIAQTVSPDGKATDISFTLLRGDLAGAEKRLRDAQNRLGFADLVSSNNVAKISVVGLGISGHAGVAASIFRTLAEKSINIQMITTSEIRISILVQEDYLELALRTLHTRLGLDAD